MHIEVHTHYDINGDEILTTAILIISFFGYHIARNFYDSNEKVYIKTHSIRVFKLF